MSVSAALKDTVTEGDFPHGGGELGALIRTTDWSRTSLGPISSWPSHLKSAISLMLPAKAQIILFWGPEFIALYNDAYAPTIGEKHPRALGRPARENWAELWDDLEPLLLGVLRSGESIFAKDRPFYIERHGYPENVYFNISYSPICNEVGSVEGVLCIVEETTERVLAQRELSMTQERLSQALNASGMIGTFDWDLQTNLIFADGRLAMMFSVEQEDGQESGIPVLQYMAGIHSEDAPLVTEAIQRATETGEKYVQDYRVRRPDATYRWIEARGRCLYDEVGNPTRFVGVAVDITDQKEAVERERLLMQEQRHRIKNLLAVIDALIRFSAKSAQSTEEMTNALRGRLKALIEAKDLVHPGTIRSGVSHVGRTTMEQLVRTVLQPYVGKDYEQDRILMVGPTVEVGSDAVTALALALHESATNAIKYGALSTSQGLLRVEWEVRGADLHIRWQESGGPAIAAAPTELGFGSMLCEKSIVGQLGGKLNYEWRPEGLKLSSVVPLGKLSA